MKIIQKRFSNRATFIFGESQLAYTIKDSSGSRSFSIEYGSIPTDSNELEERNVWFRNAGIFWIVLGLIQIGMRIAEQKRLMGSIWFTLGVIFFIAHWVIRTKYSVINTDKGSIFVIRNKQHEQVMNELDARRNEQWRQWYGEVNLDNNPAEERKKFDWLKEKKVISEAEYNEAMNRITQRYDLLTDDDADETSKPIIN